MRIFATLSMLAIASLACAVPADFSMPANIPVTATQTASTPFSTPEPTITPQYPYKAIVTEPLNVRDGSGVENAILTTLSAGDTVTVYEEREAADGGLWVRIDTGMWINSKYMRRNE